MKNVFDCYLQFKILLIFVLALAASQLNNNRLTAEDRPIEAAIEMLGSTWENRLSLRQQADQLYESADAKEKDLTYAYLLTKIKQNDVRKALQAADALLKIDADHVNGHRAKSWLLLLTRQYDSALVELKNYAAANDKASAELAKEDAAEVAEKMEHVRALGRMIGFFRGPLADHVSESNVDEVERLILDKATDEEKGIFNDQADRVVKHYNDILLKKETTDADLLDEAKVEQAQELKNLKKSAEEIVARRAELIPQIEKLREEAAEVFAMIEAKAIPLQSDLEQLNSDANSIENDIAFALAEAADYDHRARHERDAFAADRWFIRADRCRSLANRYDLQLGIIYRNIRAVKAALQSVNAEYVTAQNRYGGQLNLLESELQALNKDKKRNEGKTRRTEKPVRISGGISKALENRARSIKSYENFPVDLQRDRLASHLQERLK